MHMRSNETTQLKIDITIQKTIDLVLREMEKVRQQVKCSEDFYPREKIPYFNLSILPNVFSSPDKEKMLQHFIIHWSSNGILEAFMQQAKILNNPQFLPINAAAGLSLGYGECGVMTSLLMINLMKLEKFSLISRFDITSKENEHHNHAVVVVTLKNGKRWAFDPFFNIYCPFDNYWTQEKVVSYFNSLNPKIHLSQNLKTNRFLKIEEASKYNTELQKMAFPIFEEQINTLLSKPPQIKEFENNINFAKSLTVSYDSEILINWLKKYFIQQLGQEATKIVNRSLDEIRKIEFENKEKINVVKTSPIKIERQMMLFLVEKLSPFPEEEKQHTRFSENIKMPESMPKMKRGL